MLLAAANDTLTASLADSLADMALLRRALPERPEEIQALAADVLAQGVDHLLCLPGEKNWLWALCDLLRAICRGGGRHASKTDISIFGSDTGQSISFALEYYADLFSEADMARMAGDYVRLVELMTGGDPNAPVPFAPSPALLTPAHRLTSEVSPRLRQGIAALAAHGGVAPAAVMRRGLSLFSIRLWITPAPARWRPKTMWNC